MRPGFDGAPVVAGGDDHRVHAVHDALVVRGRPVGIRRGEGPGLDDAIPHLFAAERAESSARRECQFRNRIVQVAFASRRSARLERIFKWTRPPVICFHARRQAFAGGVDRVGAHRVAHIVDKMGQYVSSFCYFAGTSPLTCRQ